MLFLSIVQCLIIRFFFGELTLRNHIIRYDNAAIEPDFILIQLILALLLPYSCIHIFVQLRGELILAFFKFWSCTGLQIFDRLFLKNIKKNIEKRRISCTYQISENFEMCLPDKRTVFKLCTLSATIIISPL